MLSFSQVVLSVIFVAVLLVLFNMLDLDVLLLLFSLFLYQVNYEFSLHREIRCEYSPWGREESDMTERLHFHFSLSCIGEGNGHPLVFLPGESRRQRSWVGCCLWGHTESDTTEVT